METRKTGLEDRRTARLVRENNRREARGLEPLESLDNIDEEEVPDVLLNQAAEILTDMATMTNSEENAVLSRANRL
jgi:carboxyl-terminal processing protease